MTTIVKAANAAEFLGLVPQLLGCHVERSLVLVPFIGPRTGGAMRVDLPPDPDADVDAFAGTVLGMICKVADVDGVALIVYCPEQFGEEGPAMPRRRLIDALTERARRIGLRVVDALCVAADAWGSYLDDPPGAGAPLTAIAVAARPGEAPLPTPAADPLAACALPAVDLAAKEYVGRALIAIEEAVELLYRPPREGRRAGERRFDPRALGSVVALDDLPAFFEHALTLDPDELDPFVAAMLIWCLDRPSLRDVAISGWYGGLSAADTALDAQLRWEDGEAYPEEHAAFMWGDGPRPDARRLERAVDLMRRLAASAPRVRRPGTLATASWLSWALGRSSHAAHFAGEALRIDPEHGLSEIVLTLVGAGHLPEWAFTREHAGDPLTADPLAVPPEPTWRALT
ncbi:DUF4192 family protein [Microbacterium hominis]|uniref:DUF4192 family protein n=1 Tax=Microbacterium hominis TaxID=162426 RepID=A0A7D4TLF2_9MICO|nr:DUF4192 family protein [Microbacterium hominis]QKJ18222.1 DUF4192 family protein [Microbacterium hominis]